MQLQPLTFQNLLRYGNVLFSDRIGRRTFDRPVEHIGSAETLYLDIAALYSVSVEQLSHPPNGAIHILESFETVSTAISFLLTAFRQKSMADSSQGPMPTEHRNGQARAEHRHDYGRLSGKEKFTRLQIYGGEISAFCGHGTFL